MVVKYICLYLITLQEVIMTLDNCRRDFVELIKRFELFERSDLQSRYKCSDCILRYE